MAIGGAQIIRGVQSAPRTVAPALGHRPLARPIDASRDSRSLGLAARRILTVLVFGVVPVVLTLAMLGVTFSSSTFLYDFHGGLYNAGRDIVHGLSPYRPGFLKLEAAVLRAGGTPRMIDVPVYPAPALLAFVPLSLLPYKLAAVIFIAVSIAALIVALRLFEVRDWRCYGAAFLSWPVLSGLKLGAVNPLLVLGLAVAWRCRHRALASGAAIAAVVIAKVFPWTAAAWLLTTRRVRAFVASLLIGALVTLGAWAVIGFHGITAYPGMLSNLSYLQRSTGVSVVAALLAVGVTPAISQAASLLITALVLIGAAALASRPDGDRRALGLAVVAALVASPNVWPHYFTLALVPIALMSPGFSPIWLIPLLADLAPVAQTHGNGLLMLPYLAIEAILVVRLIRPCSRA